jgi:hypothetical protein
MRFEGYWTKYKKNRSVNLSAITDTSLSAVNGMKFDVAYRFSQNIFGYCVSILS